ncbi:MAG: twin-arginine translocase subunit TatC [Helicobacteraceae bacterium]
MLEDLKPHIAELRSRLIKIIAVFVALFMLSFSFWQYLLEWVKMPLVKALKDTSSIIAKTVPEQMITALVLSLFGALILGLPFYLYQIWRFIAPGLYASEKKIILPFVFFATLMFLAGALFGYYIVFPFGFDYLVNFGGTSIVAMISIGEYVSFFTKLMIGFGISFELPVVCFFLAKIGLITDKTLIGFFRYAIILIFIVAAILTPPDVFSQLLMALPLVFLYGVSIVIVRFVNKAQE